MEGFNGADVKPVFVKYQLLLRPLIFLVLVTGLSLLIGVLLFGISHCDEIIDLQKEFIRYSIFGFKK